MKESRLVHGEYDEIDNWGLSLGGRNGGTIAYPRCWFGVGDRRF